MDMISAELSGHRWTKHQCGTWILTINRPWVAVDEFLQQLTIIDQEAVPKKVHGESYLMTHNLESKSRTFFIIAYPDLYPECFVNSVNSWFHHVSSCFIMFHHVSSESIVDFPMKNGDVP